MCRLKLAGREDCACGAQEHRDNVSECSEHGLKCCTCVNTICNNSEVGMSYYHPLFQMNKHLPQATQLINK